MAKTCELLDTLVSNSGIVMAKGTPGRVSPSKMLAAPCHIACKTSRYSNRTVKHSIDYNYCKGGLFQGYNFHGLQILSFQ